MESLQEEEYNQKQRKSAFKIDFKKIERNHKLAWVEEIKIINKSLEPQFKLTRIDIEDIQNSKALHIGDWNSGVSPSLLIEKKKDQWRK